MCQDTKLSAVGKHAVIMRQSPLESYLGMASPALLLDYVNRRVTPTQGYSLLLQLFTGLIKGLIKKKFRGDFVDNVKPELT